MKKTTFTSVAIAIAVIANTLSAWAIPLASSNIPFDYLVRGRDLSRLSVGVYGFQAKRGISYDATGQSETLDTSRTQAYLGVDVLRWLTLYGIAGNSESQIGDYDKGGSQGEFGFGFRINLLHHFIREPVPLEDVVRLNFATQYLFSGTDSGLSSVSWNELSSALTFALVNHTDGNKFFSPESIAIYAGPFFSILASSDLESEDNMGVLGGIEFFFTDTFTADLQVQMFEESTVGAGFNFRF